MKHQFLHIGDIHLHPGPRQADRVKALTDIVAFGLSINYLAAWLIPGDIFHTKSTIEDRNIMVPLVQTMARHAPVLIVRGNHDAPGDLDIFAALDSTWPIIVVTSPRMVNFLTSSGHDVSVACLPYPDRVTLVGEGLAPQEVAESAAEALDAILMVMADDVEKAQRAGAITLALAHINVGGSESSTGQPQIGREIELAPGHIARLGVGFFALSHIHKHQEIHGGVYAGSICRLDFGENEPKGFIVATYDDDAEPIVTKDGLRRTYQWKWEFKPLDVPNQLTIVGHLSPDRFQIDPAQSDDPLLTPGSDLRVRYTYDRAQASLIDPSRISKMFAKARTVKLEPQPIHEAQVRAPEIAAAKTLEEKVKAYCTRMNIAWSDGLAAKVAALQAPATESMEVDA